MSSHAANSIYSKDLYKILRVSPTATVSEIKLAYYQVAQQLHPDKHNGCSQKLESFKEVNEAYGILSDQSKRNEYDFRFGFSTFNSNRRTPLPKDYRKFKFTARPPPHWKTVWDHAKHYNMHYGDGMQQEAIKQAMKSAEREGAFEYHSPLGKGFTFDHVGKDDSILHGTAYNPYSKRTPQGPPKVVFEYTEGHNLSGKEQILRHERIVRDMHSRRSERVARSASTEGDNHQAFHYKNQHQQQQRSSSHYSNSHSYVSAAAAATAAAPNEPMWPYSQYRSSAGFGSPTTENNRSNTAPKNAEKDACAIM